MRGEPWVLRCENVCSCVLQTPAGGTLSKVPWEAFLSELMQKSKIKAVLFFSPFIINWAFKQSPNSDLYIEIE